jgi:dienelactone hydrolase
MVIRLYKTSLRRLFLLAATLAAWDPARAADPASRLDRRNLLECRDDSGAIVPVRTPADWRRRRAEIVAGMEAVMGPLPGPERRLPLDLRVEEEKDFGTYVRRRITYQSEPGSRVPAHLFLPKDVLAGRGPAERPAVLCLMGSSGHRHADTPPGPNASANPHDGEVLAARGFVAISPPYPVLGFGSRSGIAIPHQPDLRALGYRSGTMKAIWDNRRALDVLETLPFVKRSGFGAIGHSLGGHNAVYTAVFDERLRVVISSCGLDSYLDYRATHWVPGRGWAQELYMPRILDYAREEIPFDFHELIGALAPRAVLINAPVRDSNFSWRSVARVAAAALPVFQLHGVPGLLRVVHPDAAHEFPPEIRELAYAWLAQNL